MNQLARHDHDKDKHKAGKRNSHFHYTYKCIMQVSALMYNDMYNAFLYLSRTTKVYLC